MSEESLGSSLLRAAKWHWNLLGVGAGAIFGVLSGAPVGVLAIVGGLELVYLTFLGLNTRFQNVLRAKEKYAPRPATPTSPAQLQQLLSFLSMEDTRRFAALRQRCADLLELRRAMDAKDSDAADQFRGEGLDRMLWLFLKLLHQKSGLERFLASTTRESIETELTRSEAQLKEALARQQAAPTIESRLATSIRERITTVNERLDNHRQAGENWELVCAEIDKTEQQINRLCEVGMTLRDSGELATQIDSISSSLQSSERAFADASIAGLLLDEAPPPLLSGRLSGTTSSPPPPLPRVAQSE